MRKCWIKNQSNIEYDRLPVGVQYITQQVVAFNDHPSIEFYKTLKDRRA